MRVIRTSGADSLSERRAAKEKVDMVEVEVACGKLDKENCAVVVPEINGKTVSQNVRLKPLESKGSVDSVNGLCDGDVQMAVVQADVLAVRSAKPDCAGKISVLMWLAADRAIEPPHPAADEGSGRWLSVGAPHAWFHRPRGTSLGRSARREKPEADGDASTEAPHPWRVSAASTGRRIVL